MNQVAARLAQDHRELDSLLQCLAQDAEAPCAGVLESTWDAVERRLTRHMLAEEQFLLPLVEASNPVEVARARQEHARIRDMMAALGLAIELHTVRAPDIYELIDLLRAHAKHEGEALYALAGSKASVAVEHSLFAKIKSALHRDAASDAPAPGART
jgi:hemerythrin HHE cation binding domain-containing protein